MAKATTAYRQQGRNYVPFGVKLLISYVLLIIFPIFIFGYIANAILVDSIRTQTRSAIQGTLQQIEDNMRYKIEDTERLSELLYYDTKLSKQLMHYEEGWVSYEATTDLLLPKFWQTIESTNRSVWLTVYLRNETLPEIYYDNANIDLLKVKGKFFDMLHLSRIGDKDWYTSYPEEKFGETLQWKQVEDDAKYGRISLLRRIVDTTNPTKLQEIGFVRISTYLDDIFQSVDSSKIGGDSTLVIMDKEGKMLYSSGESLADDYLVIEQQLPELHWKLNALIPSSIIEKDTKKVNRLTIIICVLCGIMITLVATIVSRTFSRRVLKVVSVLQSFRQGDFHRRIQYSGSDEFTTIASSLNELGKKTQSLIEEVYVTNLKKKEAELEVLQAQINPHFLYNTLSSISRLAKFGEVDKQHQMIMNLAKFYRLTLNEGHTVIPIEKELEQVKAYMDIQQIKYAERVEVSYEIDPSIAGYSTVKLILQPFIENALEHAWRGDLIRIRIVGGRNNDAITFMIIDDGSGMPQTTINDIFSTEGEGRSGYGIRNVHDRIQLYYGKEYGVSIDSSPGQGTCVHITIPAQSGF